MLKYLIAVRPFSFVASAFPVTAGAMLAEDFSLTRYILSLIAAVLLHAGVNTTNDYFDYKSGVDTKESLGSSGLLVSGKITLKEELFLSVLCYIASVVLGIFLIKMSGLALLWIGLVGLVLGYAYTGHPFYLKYRALGMFLVFTLMGPLMVLGAYYVQTGRFSVEALFVSVPIGIATDLILLANEIRDSEYDRKSGIKTLPILIGDLASSYLYAVLVGLIYVFVFYLVVTGVLKSIALVSLVALFLYAGVMRQLFQKSTGKKSAREIAAVDRMSALAEMVLFVSMILGLMG
ncbi:MAG: 1,4-dihydroxy-2-naphthoate polyprenyltransferase [Thermotoga sp.]|nr:1,4-dihydroxy-2-naphthoate polyprenyltransferase [Thermotoga sp.]MDK2949783.1 1,4-dihydroxy-2-naphthoate polyprenyltransferase [Thermotoga sp.]